MNGNIYIPLHHWKAGSWDPGRLWGRRVPMCGDQGSLYLARAADTIGGVDGRYPPHRKPVPPVDFGVATKLTLDSLGEWKGTRISASTSTPRMMIRDGSPTQYLLIFIKHTDYRSPMLLEPNKKYKKIWETRQPNDLVPSDGTERTRWPRS